MPNKEPREINTPAHLAGSRRARLRGGLGVFFAFLALGRGAVWATTSSQSGPWSQTATWGGSPVPTGSDTVLISAGHVVTVDITTATASTTTINGTLSFSRVVHSSLTLVGGNIEVNPGGLLDMGTAASPIQAGVNAHLVLAYGNSPGAYGLIVRDGGSFSVYGSSKTHATTALVDLSPTSGLSFTVEDAAGWQPGDSLVISPTRKTLAVSISTVASVAGNTVNVPAAFTDTHYATWTVRVGNMTRNVLIRSSGTVFSSNSAYIYSLASNATSFAVVNGEFAYLGGSSTYPATGITIGTGGKASISSSSIHHGYTGLRLSEANDNDLDHLLVVFNFAQGIYFGEASRNRLLDSDVGANQNINLWLFGGGSNRLVRNHVYSAVFGIKEADSGQNTYEENRSWAHTGEGFTLNYGDYRSDTSNAIGTGNKTYLNNDGVMVSGRQESAFIDSYSYANDIGWSDQSSLKSRCYRCALGYSSSGQALPNETWGVSFGPGAYHGVVLLDSRLQPFEPVDLGGLTATGMYLISYNQDYATGTLRLWGEYTISASTWTLDHGIQLYASTATVPKLMRGSGHSATVCSTNDSTAVSQLVTIERAAGVWQVRGSASGALGTITSGGSCPGSSFGQFSLVFSQGASPQDGDAVDFALIAASQDQNRQKSLLFGPADAAFNSGRSKLSVAPTGGLVLRGVSGAHTLVDMQAGSTYYSIVSSGAFTAQFSSFTRLDSGGLQLSGSRGISISSSVFDYMGFTVATSAFITISAATSTLSLPNMTFSLSQSSAGQPSAYNVRVVGNNPGLSWTFAGAGGALAGEAYDDDPNNNITWQGASNQFSISAVYVASITATVSAPGATSYTLIASTASDMTGTVFLSSTANTALASLTVGGLGQNATYYLRFTGAGPSVSFVENLQSVTLARAPDPLSFSAIGLNQFDVTWPANGNPSGTRYEARISTDINFTVTWDTAVVTAGTSRTFSSLAANTTYFARVRAVNHAGVATADALGAVVTNTGIITISANKLTSLWYNTAFTAFNAQGAVSYHYNVTTDPSYQPTLADPSFGGAGLLLALPQGQYYFHVRGLDGGGSTLGYAHFGPLFTDIAAPAVASLSAQKSAIDPSPIADGGSFVATTPHFRWPEPSSVSPVVGYSFAISTNSSDTPPPVVNTTLTFKDQVFTQPNLYFVKVRAQNLAGNWGPAAGMSLTFTTVPSENQATLKKNYFNPLRGECARIEVLMASQGRLKLELYTLLGQKVETLADQEAGAGVYNYSWCGRNRSNELVATGVYILHLEAPDQKKDYKIIVAK